MGEPLTLRQEKARGRVAGNGAGLWRRGQGRAEPHPADQGGSPRGTATALGSHLLF